MEYNELVNAIALEVIREAYPVGDENDPSLNLNALIRSKEKKEAPLKSEAHEKAEAPETKEVLNHKQAEPRVNIDKMAQDNATNYLKFVKKKVSNYV